jgi:glycosyltransferase involved in cell wall biosynthesis
MFIRRSCLDDVGFFNERDFGMDRGAEDDFCLRARARGWRNVLAADVFVGNTREILRTENPGAIDLAFPYYRNLLSSFISDDETLVLRRNVDARRLIRMDLPIHLFITHGLGGGTEQHINHMCTLLEGQGIHPIVIFSLADGIIQVRSSTLNDLRNLLYRSNSEFGELVALLRQLPIRHIHFHSNINVGEDLLALPGILSLPYDCTVHDYSWFCPRLNLIDGNGKFCKQPPLTVCESCVRSSGVSPAWINFPFGGLEPVKELRERSQRFLAGARMIFCPSKDARDRMAAAFELSNLGVRPHPDEGLVPHLPELHENPAGTLHRIALLGAITPHKGLSVFRDCAEFALRNEFSLQFVVLGYTSDDTLFANLPNVEITGPYEQSTISDLIQRYRPHIAFFPNIWPETYSYTLSIAFRHRLFPVAFDLGAIAERIRANSYGQLLPAESSPEDITTALLRSSRKQRLSAQSAFDIGQRYPAVLADYYDLDEAFS